MTSNERFQRALATASDDHMFQNVPVDWWDEEARVWRPSVLQSRVAGGTHAEIMAPGPDVRGDTEVNYISKPVAIGQLRPSQLIDEQIAQFFTTRYTLELVDSLMPCLDLASSEERDQLDRVLNDLLDSYISGYASWLDAFAEGSEADGLTPAVDWHNHAVDAEALPRHATMIEGRVDIFTAIETEQESGAIDCSPVALWDETARMWRPTMMLGATGNAEQFGPAARVAVLVPGAPVDVVPVTGSLLQPLEIADTCFSLIAIPVLARDYLRMHDALRAAGFDAADVVAHPFVIAFAKMLSGAAEEWLGLFEEGLPGPEPEPRVIPLPPSVWGMTSEDNEAINDRVRG